MFPKTVTVLKNEHGQPEHLIVEYHKGHLRCFCSSGPFVVKRRLAEAPFSQHLICAVCNEDLRRWEKFWERQALKKGGENGQGEG